MIGTVAIAYGLALATIGGDISTGLIVAGIGWAIRRYHRPQPSRGRYRRI